MHLQKNDLEGTHYHWDDVSRPIFTGQPTRRSFNRFNGDQVLFLINFYGSLSGDFTVRDGKTIERKILHEMPYEICSEISVVNWMRDRC